VIERSDAGQITLKDVGSLNGTYVNRKRVDEAELHYRDEVQIGRYRLSVVIGGERERRDGAE
jgi:pSer/pThr/pTyr-binding forkhead associated (FHA) protein